MVSPLNDGAPNGTFTVTIDLADAHYLRKEIAARTPSDGLTGSWRSESEIVARDLDRYYSLLATSLPTFTTEDALTLVAACCTRLAAMIESDLVPTYMPRLLWVWVAQDVQANRTDDDGTLVDCVRGLSEIQCLAIMDVAERFLIASRMDDITDVDLEVLAHRAGLVADEPHLTITALYAARMKWHDTPDHEPMRLVCSSCFLAVAHPFADGRTAAHTQSGRCQRCHKTEQTLVRLWPYEDLEAMAF